MNRFAAILILVIVCGLVFFTGLHRHDFIKTEGLRAVVVQEMLEGGGLGMPTVHDSPYLKKPPLYAWTTTVLARCAGRFDEQIARLPSAVCGTLFVLMMYVLGERWGGRGGGLVAAVLTLMNPTVADYSVRAELDLPFGFLCTACLVLTLIALGAQAAAAGAAWLAAYALALGAAMWKGPHSLIFMWLTMIGYGWLHGDWSFFKKKAQWLGLVVTLLLLAWWAKTLSGFAGSGHVGRTAGRELLVRLVPYRGEDFLSILTFLPLLIVVTLPASAFALLLLWSDVRTASGLPSEGLTPSGSWKRRFKENLRDCWQALKSRPILLAIVSWLVPNFVFMALAPAKAPRYSIPIFAPVILLATWLMVRLDSPKAGDARRHAARVWQGIFVVLAAGGAFGFVRAAAGLAGHDLGIGRADQPAPWLALGIGCIAPLVSELRAKSGCSLAARSALCLAAVVASQPALHGVWWPARVAADSQREVASRIDEIVPLGQRVFVLGKHEYPDTQFYCDRGFKFVESIDAALSAAGSHPAYAIARADELQRLAAGAAASYSIILEFQRADSANVLIEIRPAAQQR